MRIDDIVPARGQHMLVVGQNGMGKSYFCEQVLLYRSRRAPSVVVFDTKNDPENYLAANGWRKYETLKEVIEAGNRGERLLVYSPNRDEEANPEMHDRFFSWIYHRQNTTVCVDEVLHVCYRQEIPEYYRAILTRGRALGISVVSGTQWPKNIPMGILSESKLTACFYLSLESHRQRVAEWVPIEPDEIAALPPRYFFFWRQGWQEASGPHILTK